MKAVRITVTVGFCVKTVKVDYLLDLTFKISKQPLVELAALLILAFCSTRTDAAKLFQPLSFQSINQ